MNLLSLCFVTGQLPDSRIGPIFGFFSVDLSLVVRHDWRQKMALHGSAYIRSTVPAMGTDGISAVEFARRGAMARGCVVGNRGGHEELVGLEGLEPSTDRL